MYSVVCSTGFGVVYSVRFGAGCSAGVLQGSLQFFCVLSSSGLCVEML